jgi:hypothetical protein
LQFSLLPAFFNKHTMPTFAEDTPPVIPDHPAHHPGHKLKWEANDDGQFFVCNGCMEHGAGTRYRCEHKRCNFYLHTCCAVTPDTLTHPMFGNDSVFVFLREPPTIHTTTGGIKGVRKFRACIACGEDVRGFVYHCFDDGGGGLDLHPYCATNLPEHDLRDDHDMAPDDAEKRGREIRRPAAARHRRWVGRQEQESGRDRPPVQENTQPDRRTSELRRQETWPSRDTTESDARNGGRERRSPAARHRMWKP